MSPTIDTPLEAFQKDVAAAGRMAFESRIEWSVREAQLERRLAALNQKASRLTRPAANPLPLLGPARDAVSLYASRWCHVARQTLVLGKSTLP